MSELTFSKLFHQDYVVDFVKALQEQGKSEDEIYGSVASSVRAAFGDVGYENCPDQFRKFIQGASLKDFVKYELTRPEGAQLVIDVESGNIKLKE